MRGKKPKERKSYVLRVENGTLVEVTREVYLEWYQSRRRERYQNEKMKKHGVCSLEGLEENGCFSVQSNISPEEEVFKKIYIDKLREAMENLPEEDVYLIYLLFFEEVTVKEAAQLCGCSRKTIQNRRKKILNDLCQMMHKGLKGNY
ncbi:sigma-70 family RNA polymerase sigma factor [bacterium]|nr:sigma-70 family RNA polymerase sigma factor [bacterium]MDY3023142.1 sigma factor-like helix-turn-helix DNA-binding protein [Oliverpabstia sp.]